jgi:xanthine dehydrogenase YagR molybdenum-binding subunit
VEPELARSQIIGGMIWGLGQALFEETRMDPRTGRWTNANLAEALIPTHSDIPQIEVAFVPEDDTSNHPIGMKGLAEIGVVGPAPAIANALFDATGQRHRSLPLTIDARISAQEKA